MPKKKCSTCPVKRKRKTAKVGKVSTGAYVAGAVLLLGVGAALYFSLNGDSSNSVTTSTNVTTSTLTSDAKRKDLIKWINTGGDSEASKSDFADIINNQLTDSELDAVYSYIFDYVKKGKNVKSGTAFYSQLVTISNKYNIFT